MDEKQSSVVPYACTNMLQVYILIRSKLCIQRVYMHIKSICEKI